MLFLSSLRSWIGRLWFIQLFWAEGCCVEYKLNPYCGFKPTHIVCMCVLASLHCTCMCVQMCALQESAPQGTAARRVKGLHHHSHNKTCWNEENLAFLFSQGYWHTYLTTSFPRDYNVIYIQFFYLPVWNNEPQRWLEAESIWQVVTIKSESHLWVYCHLVISIVCVYCVLSCCTTGDLPK